MFFTYAALYIIAFLSALTYNTPMENNSKARARQGALTSVIGIICNIVLAAAKITVGHLFGLVSVTADGFNNLSDCGSSIVSLVSFYIAEKPADKEHPFGHRRAEYIASMITGFLVLFVAAELFIESINKITGGAAAETSVIVYIVLGASVAVKACMFAFYKIKAKSLSSDALNAAAVDSLCDCAATSAVIIGILILQFTGFQADGWAGILVALFILWQGIGIFKDAGSKLLGQAPDETLVEDLKKTIVSKNKVLGIHDLHIYCYGNDAYFATVHVEMDAALPPLESHEILDALEIEVKEKLGVSLTAHLDPIDLNDSEARELEAKVADVIKKDVSPDLRIHDFRLIRGAVDKAIFDAVAPFDCKIKDEDLRTAIEIAVGAIGKYIPVVTIERE